VVVVHPGTGEVLPELHQLPGEAVADALGALREASARLRAMERACTDDLRRRLAERGRSRAMYGDYEVAIGRESSWDADELEAVLGDLVAHGTVTAGEVADVIRREAVVSKTEAKRLAARLTGDARETVEACCTWRSSGRLTVTESAPLLDAGPEHD
jgi:hypothetical protein